MATMRQARRLKAHASARLQRSGITMLWPALDAECFTDEGDDAPRTCSVCEGEVKSDDDACPHCGGTGREGW
jgi:predicted amidophosphoribosyltransferase